MENTFDLTNDMIRKEKAEHTKIIDLKMKMAF